MVVGQVVQSLNVCVYYFFVGGGGGGQCVGCPAAQLLPVSSALGFSFQHLERRDVLGIPAGDLRLEKSTEKSTPSVPHKVLCVLQGSDLVSCSANSKLDSHA